MQSQSNISCTNFTMLFRMARRILRSAPRYNFIKKQSVAVRSEDNIVTNARRGSCLDLKFIRLDYAEPTRAHSKIDSIRQRAKMLYQFSGNSELAICRSESRSRKAIAFACAISSRRRHVTLHLVVAACSMFFTIVSVMT